MPHRKAKIQDLIDEFRHRGIGDDEVYDEIAARLHEDHVFNRVFTEALMSKAPKSLDTEHLKDFYDAFREGTYDLEDGSPE